MKPLFGIFGLLLCAVFLLQTPASALAASLYIDPPISTLYRGDAVNFAVRLDVDESAGECVNAVDAVVSFPENIEPVDVSIGNSILSMWVEKPTINLSDRTVTFAGGIPNGYCGRVAGDPLLTNVLAELVFRSPVNGALSGTGETDTAQLTFERSSSAYLNDGFGTQAQLTTYPARITLESGAGEVLVNSWQDKVNEDTIAPEKFSIFLEKQNTSGKYFVVFNTTDKQTGVDTYQVMEEPLSQRGSFDWGRADAPWIEARSPYVLKDQTLNSTIRVKAIDKAGNEYVATLVPEESLRMSEGFNLQSLILIMFGAITLFVLIAIGVFLLRKRKPQKTTVSEMTNVDAEPEESEHNVRE